MDAIPHPLARAATLLLIAAAAHGTALAREDLIFNRDFRFLSGEHPGAEQPGFNDAEWERVGLPHSFSIPYFAQGFYIGEGWYRKHFEAPAAWKAKRVHLVFGAAFQHATVFVNGQVAGRHNGGYTSFDVDITPYIATGRNVLAVKLDNKWDPVLPPRAGEHTFSAGLYRDVRLVVTDALRIPHNGLAVTTPDVSAESAGVKVVATLCNDGATARSATVNVEVIEPDQKTVAGRMQAECRIAAGTNAIVELRSPSIRSPKLWHPDHPFLYAVRVSVVEKGETVDEVSTRTGFRWFTFTADKGFFLNGEHLWLRGANVHQDHAGWGDAVTDAGAWRDVKLIKDAGFNWIRGSHYPHAQAFLDACDELGVLYWSEFCFWGIGGFGGDGYWKASAYPINKEHFQAFDENCLTGLGEMIADARNHPSIFIWSMSNEPFFTAGWMNVGNTAVIGGKGSLCERARELCSAMVKRSHELDPTRLTTVGGAQRGGFHLLGDVASFNGDGDKQPNPGIPSIVSEYGSHMSARPGNYEEFAKDAVAPIVDWRCGEAVWCGFHHGSICGKGFGSMGIIDYFRLPLRSYYWYRNEYAKVPPPAWPTNGSPAKLKLEADRLTIRNDGTEDCQLVVTVLDKDGRPLSDSPRVRLQIASGPGEFPTGSSISFKHGSDIDIRDGQAAIEFRSYFAGQTLIRASSPGLEDAALTITTTGPDAWSEDLAKSRNERPYGAGTAVKKTETRDNIAFLRPTAASSSEPQNPAMDGNDGDSGTRWCGGEGTKVPQWWRVDLENFYDVEQVKITFEMARNYRYRIELSDDGEKWATAVDNSETKSTDQVRVDKLPRPMRGRFLRVFYVGAGGGWSSHYEVEVKGSASGQ